MRVLLITLFLLTLASALLAQPPTSPSKHSVEEMQRDVVFVQKALEEAHPSLYWYTPKKEISQAFADLKAKLTRPLTKREFYGLLAPVIVKVRCGHTFVVPHGADNLPVAYLPLEVWLANNRLYVVKNYSADSTIKPAMR